MVRFIDLFSGISGMRIGFERACLSKNLRSQCVFTSEIKSHAIKVLKQNYPDETIYGDITLILSDQIPDFDFLLAGFPCQSFSSAGKRLGFKDSRGNLFFEIIRILKDKKPFGFLLENVEGLVTHDRENSGDKTGRTFSKILESLKSLGYEVSWKILNAKNFGLPQDRKRIYIAGTKSKAPNLDNFQQHKSTLSDILESNLPPHQSRLTEILLSKYKTRELYGKSIKDKRGGSNNIHSWDLELKGSVSDSQKRLLNLMLKERRKKKWAVEFGIDWMDGMPLTIAQIETFFKDKNLQSMLEDLLNKGYLKLEHPKKKVGNSRVQDKRLPLGFNIVTGKMSFEINKILDPNDIAPTLVAMDLQGIFVVDGDGLRRLSLREGLRLFGYPETFKFDVSVSDGYDLLGNTVAIPVVESVAERLLEVRE